MAAKGTVAKQQIFKKIMEIYPNAFFEEEDKILRIPIVENSENIEIKLQLTAAKTNLGETGAPASAFSPPGAEEVSGYMTPPVSSETLEVSQEEKENVANLLASLGL
ncbi:MAG: hypothetical protein IKN65_06995 [Clostridia bacterium]|nr:hypothetical protein [Clostridia bacterium]